MDQYSLYRALGVAFWVFLSGVTVASAVWAIKRFCPSWAHFWLLAPFGQVIRRLVNRVLPGLLAERQRSPAKPVRSSQHPAARD